MTSDFKEIRNTAYKFTIIDWIRYSVDELELGQDAEPQAVMESLDRVDQMLAGNYRDRMLSNMLSWSPGQGGSDASR